MFFQEEGSWRNHLCDFHACESCKFLFFFTNIFNVHSSDQSSRFMKRSHSERCETAHTTHDPVQLTLEIFKTGCYFCLIIHVNCASYTKLTDSAAYYSVFFLFGFCTSKFPEMILPTTSITSHGHEHGYYDDVVPKEVKIRLKLDPEPFGSTSETL